MRLKQALAALEARQESRIELGLERVRSQLERMGSPHAVFPVVLVAGTNGKGSVSALLASALSAAGWRTGLYTSPHLVDVRERIQVDGALVSPEALADALSAALAVERARLTYFELLTAAAFSCFQRARVDIAVLEVGLGGRLDATNCAEDVRLSVVTGIHFDHTSMLGDSLREIAVEKAGIFRRGTPAVVGETAAEPLAALEDQALALGVPLRRMSAPLEVALTRWEQGTTVLKSPRGRLELGLLGARQPLNAALALEALEVLGERGFAVPDRAVREGFRGVRWPGRFDFRRTPEGGAWILDGAHNPQAMGVLLDTLKRSPWAREPVTFVAGFLKDKDWQSMSRLLAPRLGEVLVCPPPSPRALEPRELGAYLRRLAPKARVSVRATAEQALTDPALKCGTSVVCGSFYLVGAALRRFAAAGFVALALAGAAGAQDYELPITTLTPKIEFRSDTLDYDASSGTLALEGGAVVTDSTLTYRSERIVVDLENKVFRSTVPLELAIASASIKAGSGSLDLDRKEGVFRGASGEAPPWTFTAREARLERGRYVLRGARFTSCDEDPPHFHFRASKTVWDPGWRATTWNNVLYLGSVPVLYLPYWHRSLRKDLPHVTKVHVGYDKRNGGEFQTDTTWRLGPRSYNRLYLDGYTVQGVGIGDELNYNRPDVLRGTLYAYHIRERGVRDRWTVLGDHFQRLTPRWTTQARLETLSDPSFNNSYFRSNHLRISPELHNSAALVRQTPNSTTRLSYSRLDIRDPLLPDEFRRTSESAPRLDVSLSPFSVPGLPVLLTVSAFADHSIDPTRSFYQSSAGATWSMTQTYALTRRVSFVPAAGVSETWLDRVQDSTAPARFDVFTARYFTRADLRLRTLAGDLGLGHRWTRRLEENGSRLDAAAADRGTEENLLTLENVYRPSTVTRVAVSGGYDLREDGRGTAPHRDASDRLQPVIGDLTLTPRPKLSLSVREYYLPATGHESVIVQADWGLPKENHFGAGLSQSESDGGKTYASTSFGIWPAGRSWGLESVLRVEIRGAGGADDLRVDSVRAFDRELTLWKQFHDFTSRFAMRFRPGGVQEYLVRVDMRFGKGPEETLRNPQWEREWYPWRKGLEER